MSDSLDRPLPNGSLRITTGCQYCAVGCGYNALLVPDESTGTSNVQGVVSMITPAMTGAVRFQGVTYRAAVTPDARCDLNKGNHSVRGGSQGLNLVSPPHTEIDEPDTRNRSTKDRLTFPKVRLSDGRWHKISWNVLNEVLARLVVAATEMEVVPGDDRHVLVNQPEGLGVKIFEYQYLENTYAGTKLFFSAIGTPNVAFHDRPSAAGSSPGMKDTGLRPHDFSYEQAAQCDVLLFLGTNPYENQSVFFMQYCAGKEIIVVDPRRTATAQYAEQTGGLHVQPTVLGGDSILLYAICRELVRRWLDAGHSLATYPWRDRIMDAAEVVALRNEANDHGELHTISASRKRRRASRAMDFDTFVNDFLQVDDPASPYALETARRLCGIREGALNDLVNRLDPTVENRPRVGICYEKGLIWGFNYHNTAAVAALGLLLGTGAEDGGLVGRVGGHQKGWAQSKDDLSEVFVSSRWQYEPNVDGQRCLDVDYSEGYPFRNVTDLYSDSFIGELNPDPCFDDAIPVHHNLDNHVFGPPAGFLHNDQTGIPNDAVRLRNGLVTRSNPDVKLLWMIGNNYLGQTNDAQAKRETLEARMKAGGDGVAVLRPDPPAAGEALTADDIVEPLSQRMAANGIVLLHQELFTNPTTELCDLVIPAAGWGEEPLCRYNAQRRLKLYDRFQDSPLDPVDQHAVGDDDPASFRDQYLHSPKPDWMIFRDVARRMGEVLDGETGSFFANKMVEIFGWQTAANVADDMARYSHRGLAVSGSLLGELLNYGEAHGLSGEIVHTLLGASDGTADAKAPYLGPQLAGNPKYLVYDPDPQAPMITDPLFSNGIASNGVMLPVRYDAVSRELRGTWRVDRWSADKKFCFVQAPWSEIEPFFNETAPGDDQLFVTNGRFNHLWNNLFHHLRNDYVNERYPEDLPGTILEVNPDWADNRGLVNGQIVDVVSGTNSFRAIVSRQPSVPVNGAFAMFSYPVRNGGEFGFEGYVNNVSDGYADGINPIAALKYCKGTVTPVENPDGGGGWVFPRDFPNRVPRLGPTFLPRNAIRPRQSPASATARFTEEQRRAWKMRELIVSKGLPRALLHFGEKREKFFSPKEMIEHLKPLDPAGFEMALRGWMRWQQAASAPGAPPALLDFWREPEIQFVRTWFDGLPPVEQPQDPAQPTPPIVDPGDPTTPTPPAQSRYDQVVDILENAVGPGYAGQHGRFWMDKTRDEFVATNVFGLPIVQVGDADASNLIKAITGHSPFDGSLYIQMPPNRPPIPPDQVEFIRSWINDGCPDN